MKKISYLDISIFMFYILQCYLFLFFISKSINVVSYNYILYLVIAIFLGISIILLFNYLFHLSNKNIFYNINNKFIVFILVIIAFIFSIYSLNSITNYINYIYLKDINNFYIMLSFLLVIYFYIKNDIYSFFRCSTLVFYFYIFLEIITFILLIFYIDITKLLPITYDLNNIMDNCYLFICFLVIPLLFLLVIPKKMISGKKISKKIYFTYLIISLIIFIKSMISISILGYSGLSIYNYPDIIIYKNIDLFSFIERIEWLLAFNSITNMFFMIGLCLFYVKEGLIYIFPIKKKIITTPLLICLFCFIFGYFINISNIFIVWLLITFFSIHLAYAVFKLLK